MAISIEKTELFEKWLDLTKDKSLLEIEFSDLKIDEATELVGAFAGDRLAAFGQHASGSLLAFYGKENNLSTEELPVAWLDSEGAPSIVIARNFRDFVSVLPYGPGFMYSVAAAIENNLGDSNLTEKVKEKLTKSPEELLKEARERYLTVDELTNWMQQMHIEITRDPIDLIVKAHNENDDLTTWIAENLT